MGVRVCGRVGVGVGFGCVFLPALLLPRGGVALWLLAVGRSDGRERERERAGSGGLEGDKSRARPYVLHSTVGVLE